MSDRASLAADKWEIAETLARYCFAVDFWNWDELDLVFAENAEAHYEMEALGIPSVHLKGRAAIVAWLKASVPNLGPSIPRHAITNHIVDIAGDTARTRSYLNAGGPGGGGVYSADHVRMPQGWRVARFHLKNFARNPK